MKSNDLRLKTVALIQNLPAEFDNASVPHAKLSKFASLGRGVTSQLQIDASLSAHVL